MFRPSFPPFHCDSTKDEGLLWAIIFLFSLKRCVIVGFGLGGVGAMKKGKIKSGLKKEYF
jgi:hypothetical protein